MITQRISKFILNNKLLILILLISLFFRTYEVIGNFEFAHDGDLYSWIVKDIVVDHHPRLIGQLTSAKGIFIGPFFYYLLAPFFIITKMDPIGAIIPVTILSLLAIFSYYFCFKQLFNRKVGLIAAFLSSVLLWLVRFDRSVVPNTPTNLWVIWYFYVVINLARGNFKVLWILAILVALIWHIHIALAPALLAVPVAVFLSRKFPTAKQLITFTILIIFFSLPLIVFEVKHGFSQSLSLIQNFSINQGGGTGLEKFNLLNQKANLEIVNLIFYPQIPNFLKTLPFIPIILFSGIFLIRKKLLTIAELLALYAWVVGVFLFYTFSSTIVSEYYISNIKTVFLAIIALYFYILFNSKIGKILILMLFGIVLIRNLHFIITQDYYHKGYVEKKAIVEFIKNDSQKQNFPCIAVSYITTPGENVGFRYFFYLEKLHVNQPSSGAPVYTIVLPSELAEGKKEQIFGHIKVIPPELIPPKDKIKESCSGQNSNLTDSLFGYTE